MRNLQALLLVISLSFAAGQTVPAEVRDSTVDMLGPLLGLAAQTLSIDTTGIEHIHLTAVWDEAVISEYDQLLTLHGDRPASALVTVAAHSPSDPLCPMHVLLGSKLADESDYVFQRGSRITCIPGAEVTRRIQSTSTPHSLLPGPGSLYLQPDEWLTLSAVRFGDALPGPENPLNGLIMFYIYLSTDAETMPPEVPGTTAD